MKRLKSRLIIVSAFLWVIGVFFAATHLKSNRFDEEIHEPSERSSEIMIPRGLYNESFEVAFEGEKRDLWQKPDEVIETLGDISGFTIADIGCGEGYFTHRLAEQVGETGIIYASDIQEDVLNRMIKGLDPSISGRVKPILADEGGLGIPAPVDMVFLVQVLAEVPHQRQFLQDILEIMKPGARLVLIDSKHFTDPKTGYSRPINLSRLLEDLKTEGLVLARKPLHFLPKQFFLILKKDVDQPLIKSEPS